MARLVAVCQSDDDDYIFERRQVPLVVDESLTMVLQFNDSCLGCDREVANKQKEMEKFVRKFRSLSSDEIAVALMVTNKEIFNQLSESVPCVGCRRSVERLFKQLVDSGHPALEPLVVSSSGFLSIKRDFLFDPKSIFALFYVHGSKLTGVMESIPKSKKNKRCVLHSLDSHKIKPLSSWMDVWEILSQDCRGEVTQVECDNLMETLETYLRKHRFCSECKAKVLRAYSILIGEIDFKNEKGYCSNLYEGLRCCPDKNHIHVLCETDYIARLIARAEADLLENRRERHAKTLDIAQEEVLTCLGIYLYERLSKIWTKIRAEEQTWQLLFYLSVDTLKKSFEVAIEKKQGISNLELICQELLEEEQAKEHKREQKRQKRKKKKNKVQKTEGKSKEQKENCECDENTNVASTQCASCDDDHSVKAVLLEPPCSSCDMKPPILHNNNNNVLHPHNNTMKGKQTWDSCNEHDSNSRLDGGYSSGPDSGTGGSREGSDVACSEGICNHGGDSPLCSRDDLEDICDDCLTQPSNEARMYSSFFASEIAKKCSGGRSLTFGDAGNSDHRSSGALSLQDMLEATCSSGEEEDGISEEEIQRFKANQNLMNTKRQALRETLRQRFADLRQRRSFCPIHGVQDYSHNHTS